ncbi:MAG TPA: hypothetical protein VNG71_21750 [Pyrinomonadaceae bacterium]|nr:hypothetical protein [Pyrinomonadaceae bacterium]
MSLISAQTQMTKARNVAYLIEQLLPRLGGFHKPDACYLDEGIIADAY